MIGPTVVCGFLFVSFILLLNMFIAILTNAYQRVQQSATQEWILNWSATVYRAQAHSSRLLPPPFNPLTLVLGAVPSRRRAGGGRARRFLGGCLFLFPPPFWSRRRPSLFYRSPARSVFRAAVSLVLARGRLGATAARNSAREMTHTFPRVIHIVCVCVCVRRGPQVNASDVFRTQCLLAVNFVILYTPLVTLWSGFRRTHI